MRGVGWGNWQWKDDPGILFTQTHSCMRARTFYRDMHLFILFYVCSTLCGWRTCFPHLYTLCVLARLRRHGKKLSPSLLASCIDPSVAYRDQRTEEGSSVHPAEESGSHECGTEGVRRDGCDPGPRGWVHHSVRGLHQLKDLTQVREYCYMEVCVLNFESHSVIHNIMKSSYHRVPLWL